MKKEKLESGILGLAIGDALGLPVEFLKRRELEKNPVTDMREYGVWDQPKGTWSDDTTFTLCLAHSLSKGYDLEDFAQKLISAKNKGEYTAHNCMFDIGSTSTRAIDNLIEGINPYESGINSRSNGSLMRCLPLVYFTKKMKPAERKRIAEEISAVTHSHPAAKGACAIYTEFGANLLNYENKKEAFLASIKNSKENMPEESLRYFERILNPHFPETDKDYIMSGFDAVETLEAGLWSFLNSNSYSESVLTAVNLGGDTDTTGAVAGGLAGIHHGSEEIPEKWKKDLLQKDFIIYIADRLYESLNEVEK